MSPAPGVRHAARRCRRRPLPAGAPRPGDLLARFLANAVAYLVAAAGAVAWGTFGDDPQPTGSRCTWRSSAPSR